MKVEIIEDLATRPLDEDEQLFKKAWLKGPAVLWERPMSYSAYEKYIEDGIVVTTAQSHYYKDKTRDGRGITVEEISGPNQVNVSLHRRYSYPVLHNHNYVEIVYVAAGHCENLFETGGFSMKAGDVCIFAPNSLHAISCVSDESCIINMMVNRRFFDRRFLDILRGGKLLVDYLEDILFEKATSPYILFSTGDDKCLYNLACGMVKEITQKLYAYEYSLALLIGQFLLHLVRDYEESAVVPGMSVKTQNDLIIGVLSYLNVHYNQASLTETARYFGYSPSYLSRVIRESTGRTFNAIIAQIQMERAVKLLEAGEQSLTAIAQEIGCFDISHFNKKFKAAYGISPRQFLEQKEKYKQAGGDGFV